MSRQRRGEGGVRGDGRNLREQGEDGLRVRCLQVPGTVPEIVCITCLQPPPPTPEAGTTVPKCTDKDALVQSLKISP